MAVNVVLPGAVLGGDALRSVKLQRQGNPLAQSALSVLLDRLSGLWILCVLSLLTTLPLLSAARSAAAAKVAPDAPAWLGGPVPALYFIGLALAVALPLLPWPVRRTDPAGVADPSAPLWRRALARLGELHALTLERRRPLARSLWSSVAVQLLCAFTLWLCLMAAGGHATYWRVQAIAAPVFIAGVMPLSYGGFGARELVALAAFPLVGIDPQLGVAASALYGVCAVCLGLAAAPLLALRAAAVPPAAAGS
jgi:glycosyltransferase 2 family protein